jgi:uncharacterized protein YndB with AHSA1/START domain
MSNLPSTAYDGILERTTGGGVIRFERRLPYPIREVWDAITNPQRLAEWWLPFDADITVDLTEGGQLTFVSREQEATTITCTILRVEPPMLLEHTHLDADSYMRWELEPIATGCILRLSHFVTEPERAIDNCYVVGLHTSLARLAPCLADRPIAWDWDAFAAAQAEYARVGLAPQVDAP